MVLRGAKIHGWTEIQQEPGCDFAILGILAIETGLLTPPFGILVCTVKAAVPEATVGEIFRGSIPYWIALLAVIIIIAAFPQIATWLPAVGTAIATSVQAVRTNPGPMAMWGLIIAGSLVLGAIPLLVGLAVVLPVLGHATWHLYRKVVD